MSLVKQAQNQAIKSLDDLLAELSKSAEANTEPGGFDGPSSHPTAKAEDSTQTAVEGARTSENSADVKDITKSVGVEASRAQAGSSQDAQFPNMGAQQSATGEDPSVETSSAKDGKEDGGYDGPSSHPARTDNDSLDGKKFASAEQRCRARIKQAADRGQELLGRIIVAEEAAKKEAAAQIASDPTQAAKEAADAKIAGSQLAAAVSPQDDLTTAMVDAIKAAEHQAQLTAAFIQGYKKQAEDDEDDDDDENSSESSGGGEGGGESGGPPADGGGPPTDGGGELPIPPADAAAGGDPPAGGGMLPPEIMALLGAAGGDPGGAPPMDPAAGGAPPMDPAAGGAPPMDPAAGGDETAMLAEALAQAGITPEQFQAMLATKQAAALKGRKLTPGSWRPKTAEEKGQFDSLAKYVQEVAAGTRS